MSEEKSKCRCTFVYGGSSHVVETQSCVHVVHVLKKSKKILHFFKRDALHKNTNISLEMIQSEETL